MRADTRRILNGAAAAVGARSWRSGWRPSHIRAAAAGLRMKMRDRPLRAVGSWGGGGVGGFGLKRCCGGERSGAKGQERGALKVLRSWPHCGRGKGMEERRKALGFALRAQRPCRSCGGGRGEVLARRLARRVISELRRRGIEVGGTPAARRRVMWRRRQWRPSRERSGDDVIWRT